MPNELKSLSEIFNESIFRIPDYQRGYAWLTDQLVDFWEDLVNLPQGKNHYTGLLSIKRVNDWSTSYKDEEWLLNKGYKLFHIVDGQQRLTTFSIFVHEIISFIKSLYPNQKEGEIYFCDSSLKEIREKYISKKRPPNFVITTFFFGYEKGNPSSDYLIHKVYDEPDGGTISESFYTKNLLVAKNFFANNIRLVYEKRGIEGIESLYIKLTQQLKFNIHDIDSEYDEYVAFETMNNRGKRLTNLELLKNRLIYLTTLFSSDIVDDAERGCVRDDINKAWKEIYYQLGRNKDPLSDDEFLRAHWITYYQYSRKKGDDYIHFLLRHFSAKNVFSEHGVAEDQSQDTPLSDYDDAEDLVDEQESDEEETTKTITHIEIDNYVKSLQNFAEPWFYSWFPLSDGYDATEEEKKLIDRLNRIGIGYFRPLVVAAMSMKEQTTSEERCALYEAIERFIFVSFRLGGYQANYMSSEYYNKSRQILKGECTLAEVTQRLNELTDRDHSALDSFIGRVKKMFDSGGGFYSWWGLRYFLFEYEAKLTGEKGLQRDGNLSSWRLFTTSEKEKVSIEHILPQTPTEWYWQNQFRNYTSEEIGILSGSLGNLLPLSQSINSSLQNDSFEEKKNPKSSKRRGYTNGSHSEIEVAQYRDWTAQNIYDRGIKLLNFLEERWRITISQDQKNRLLNIDFVHDGRKEKAELLMTSAKDYTSYIAKILTEKLGLPWVEKRDNCVYCCTQQIDQIVSTVEKNTWTGGRLISYEFECDEETGISLFCKIASRADAVCDSVYNQCVKNSAFTNIKYEFNGVPKPTKRKRWVVVFERELLTSIEMANGLRENEQCLVDRVEQLFSNDIVELERLIF